MALFKFPFHLKGENERHFFNQITNFAQFNSHVKPTWVAEFSSLSKRSGTCPRCKMIHLQVCLPASQASSPSFSPRLPRWAKAPHLHRLQRHCLTFLPHDFTSQGGSVYLFESHPNRLWWRLCTLHESTAFHWEKYARSVVPGDDIKWKRTLAWHYSSSHKRNGWLCTFLLICVALNVLKPMSNTSSYKSSQYEHSVKEKRTGFLKLALVRLLFLWLHRFFSHQFHSSSMDTFCTFLLKMCEGGLNFKGTDIFFVLILGEFYGTRFTNICFILNGIWSMHWVLVV